MLAYHMRVASADPIQGQSNQLRRYEKAGEKGIEACKRTSRTSVEEVGVPVLDSRFRVHRIGHGK